MIRHKKVVEILIRRALSFMKAARCGTNKIRTGERHNLLGIASMISIPLQAIQAISCASFCVFYLFGKPLNFLHMLLQYM
jgi:hypothetical protein